PLPMSCGLLLIDCVIRLSSSSCKKLTFCLFSFVLTPYRSVLSDLGGAERYCCCIQKKRKQNVYLYVAAGTFVKMPVEQLIVTREKTHG
ncbi:MAG: hypothetical protein D3910_03055, partial [Candidatus Electrothrix sp. ATG2]|nr:hypothetical protein [Candidatus Electrothrix sp. ATG2]